MSGPMKDDDTIAKGGSYIRHPDGRLERTEWTEPPPHPAGQGIFVTTGADGGNDGLTPQSAVPTIQEAVDAAASAPAAPAPATRKGRR